MSEQTEIGICAICRFPIVERRTSPSDRHPLGESFLGHRGKAYRIGTQHEPVFATKSTPLFATADATR